jgi:hypothetical protein
MTHKDENIPAIAFWLGWSGVIPFLALSVGVGLLDGPWAAFAAKALVIYGAVILSFMGGAQWGIAVSQSGGSQSIDFGRVLSVSVVPALVGWVAALLALTPSLILLAIAFLVLLAFDLWIVKRKFAPTWYARLRIQLTAAVVACLVLAVIVA